MLRCVDLIADLCLSFFVWLLSRFVCLFVRFSVLLFGFEQGKKNKLERTASLRFCFHLPGFPFWAVFDAYPCWFAKQGVR